MAPRGMDDPLVHSFVFKNPSLSLFALTQGLPISHKGAVVTHAVIEAKTVVLSPSWTYPHIYTYTNTGPRASDEEQ